MTKLQRVSRWALFFETQCRCRSADHTLSETLPFVLRSFFFLYQTNVPSLYSSTKTFCHDSPIRPSTAHQHGICRYIGGVTALSVVSDLRSRGHGFEAELGTRRKISGHIFSHVCASLTKRCKLVPATLRLGSKGRYGLCVGGRYGNYVIHMHHI